jgi:putative MATE family efflux protein
VAHRSRLTSPYDRDILRLAVPAFGALVAEPVYVLTDTAIVGHLGTAQLAGLAVASAIILTAHALLIFLAYGTTGSVARLIGAGDEATAAHLAVQALWVAAGLGVVVGAAFLSGADALVGLFDADADVAGYATTYLRISAVGMPALLLTLAGTGYLRGLQDTRTPLAVAVATAVLNLVLEVVMVLGLDLGVPGSAWSTVIAQTVGAAVFLRVVLGAARRTGAGLRPERAGVWLSARSGAALFVRTAALRGAFLTATVVATGLGRVDLAAHQIGYEVWALLALAVDAVAIAGQALTGRFLGAGRADVARAAADRMIELSVAFGAVIGLLLLALRTPAAGIFTDDPAVTVLAAFVLVHVALMQPLNGVVFALDGVLIGAGDLRWLAGAMLVASAAFAACAGLVSVTGAGLGWLWGALWVLMLARAATLVHRYRQGEWASVGVT